MAIWSRLKKYREMDAEKQAEEKLSDLEKGDLFSMILSAMLTLWLPAALILIVLCILVMFLFGVSPF